MSSNYEIVMLSSNLKKLLADWTLKASKSSNLKWYHAKKILVKPNKLIEH